MLFRFLSFILIVGFFGLSPARASISWVQLARQLHWEGKTNPREKAIQKLKQRTTLFQELQVGLQNSKKRHHAQDIIVALRLTEFIPTLLESLTSDADGHSILTLNTLLSKSSYVRIGLVYRHHLMNSYADLAPPTILALVDSLGHWGIPLQKSTIDKLIKDKHYEIRIALVGYIRMMLLRHKKEVYVSWIPRLLKLNPYQARLKTLHLLNELPGGRVRKHFLKNCHSDRNSLVRNKCFQLSSNWSTL